MAIDYLRDLEGAKPAAQPQAEEQARAADHRAKRYGVFVNKAGVEIVAWQVPPFGISPGPSPAFIQPRYWVTPALPEGGVMVLDSQTKESSWLAPGAWVVRSPSGEVTAMHPDQFAQEWQLRLPVAEGEHRRRAEEAAWSIQEAGGGVVLGGGPETRQRPPQGPEVAPYARAGQNPPVRAPQGDQDMLKKAFEGGFESGRASIGGRHASEPAILASALVAMVAPLTEFARMVVAENDRLSAKIEALVAWPAPAPPDWFRVPEERKEDGTHAGSGLHGAEPSEDRASEPGQGDGGDNSSNA